LPRGVTKTGLGKVLVAESEFLAYRALCRQPWKDVVTLLYGTGMRPGEAYCLRWEYVLLNGTGGLIQIAEGKTPAARRVLPMVPEVYKMLLDRAEAQMKPAAGWVFPSGSQSGHFDENSAKNQHLAALRALQLAHKAAKEHKGEPELIAKKASVSEEFARDHAAAIEAGVKAFEPYCLRHTALTRLSEVCDSFTLAKIAGHSSISITQRYCHPQAEAIERAFAKLPEPKRLALANE
jgi:integrase